MHALDRYGALTMLLEDPGDAFVHMLLQFGIVEAEAALKGEQTNSLCQGHRLSTNRPCAHL